jgi:hypothetical protein
MAVRKVGPNSISDLRRYLWPPNALSGSQSPCLTGLYGCRQFRTSVCLDDGQRGERIAAGVDALLVEAQINAVIAERREDFEQVLHRSSRQVTSISNKNLLTFTKTGEQLPPASKFSATGNPRIVHKSRNHGVTAIDDSLPEVADEIGFKSDFSCIQASVYDNANFHLII